MARREIGSAPLSRFGVLVAQLESIAASARQQPPDPLLCFDLLSELVAAIDEETRESIVAWQRKCEDALYTLLILGARRPVRRLASVATGRVIAKGDDISIYSRASTLQGWLADSKRSEPLSVSGAAQCLGQLYRLFGRKITSGLLETTNIVAKLAKFNEDFVRQDALDMLQNALEGSAGTGATAAYSEAFRIIMRVGVNDKSFIVRLAAARCLKTFANIGGPGLGNAELESSISYCTKALDDSFSSVRDAFAEALGSLLALAMHPEAQVKPKGKNHIDPSKKLEDGLRKHLVSPFTRATGSRAKDLRIGFALSWVSFLQVVRLEYHLPDVELQNFAMQAMGMLEGNVSVDTHALACLLYIFRVGVCDQMTEPTQRSFLVLMGRKLECADYSPSVGVATLRILSYLLVTLGEVPSEFKDILDNTVVAALSHSSSHVRIEAALTLRALAEVDPTCVGGLISYGVTTLHALRESVSTEKGNHLDFELTSLHGQASVLAALISISQKLVLGYPARLPKSVFEVSKRMLTEFSRNPVAATVEKEAGWLLLASLITSMPKAELEAQIFDVLLLWADPFLGNPAFAIGQKQDLISEMRVLAAAIEALTAFIRNFISPSVSINAGILLQPVLAYLSGALSYITYLSAKETRNLNSTLDLFIIRTLIAYRSISDPMTYKSEHSKLIQLCIAPFSDPSGCEESSCLRFLLDKRDACLGPWIPGRDSFEDELRAFEGCNDGLMPCVWDVELCSFSQPEPISKMLVNQQLLCLGTIFASQDTSSKLNLLNKIDHCIKSGKKQPWHVASITNACVVLLSGLKAVLALRPQAIGTDILSSIQIIFQSILAEAETNSAQRRASSEGLGLLARLGSDIFTARMTRSLLGELAVAMDPNYMGSIAFTLGCIHRSAGGMALSTLVPGTVSSVSLLAKNSNACLQLWSLHSLLLTIEAAGLSYVPQVQATLFLAIEIILSEENGLFDLRQEIGRLVNAIVAILGPELSPGSTFFSRCKSVIAEISSCQEISNLFESIRFTQQLVLFAPQAVPVHSHVENLLPTLASRQPSLRYLAVSTLRHLIEKDPVAVIGEKIEECLFHMLDEENDSEIGNLVRATITSLLYTSCPSCPSRWLAIFHNMVLATSQRNVVANTRSQNDTINGTTLGSASIYYGEDNEDMIASSDGKQVQGSASSISGVEHRRNKHLRYRTRVFAAECLSCMPTAVGTDPAHFDLSLARNKLANGSKTSGDWLVMHLQELISLSYQISTSQFEGMQSIGIQLLSIIMDKFDKIPDPELPEHFLLEQYQAQLVSAVRSAINISSSPLLLDAGLELATKILTSSVISGDRVAVSRMFALISRPINEVKDLYYPSFAEWVASKIKVRLLAAHASIKCYVYQFIREQKAIPDEYLQLMPLFSSSSTVLGKYWGSVLKDYCYICFGVNSELNYVPFLDGIQSPLVASRVQKCLDEAWPLILKATALDAVPLMIKKEKPSNNNDEGLENISLLSGFSMVELEPREFQFLWGLALLMLFQGQPVEVGKQVMTLIVNPKKKYSWNMMPQKTHGWLLCDIALPVFMSLSKEVFFNHEFLSSDLCIELLQVLLYSDHVEDTWSSLTICLLSQIMQLCPIVFFENEDFTSAAMELFFKHLIVFKSESAVSQDFPHGQDSVSELIIVAETIVCRMSSKLNQWKFILAIISICHEWFRGASSVLSLSKAFIFFRSLLPSLKKYFRDADKLGFDECIKLQGVVESWANTIAFWCQDSMRRIHLVNDNVNDSLEFHAKILAFCLEEAVALARLLHCSQLGSNKSGQVLLFTIFKSCSKCISDALYDSNIQVQTVGLHVLKNIVQKDIADGSHVKNCSLSLFFIGELFKDIFCLVQHNLKEHRSRESISVTEECLRLLFLFHTLSQASECALAITILLLEALLMVFSVSNQNQDLNEVKTSTMRLVSHLVQIPSSAARIKDAIISMSATHRQQIQDMIRASVTQGQRVMQAKLNVQSELNVGGVLQVYASSPADEHDIERDEDDDDDDDDDDDWDTFQSFPVEDESSDSVAIENGSMVDSVGEARSRETDVHVAVSLEVGYVLNRETCTGLEMGSLDSNVLDGRSDIQLCKEDEMLEIKCTIEEKGFGNDQQTSDSFQPDVGSEKSLGGYAVEEKGQETVGCETDANFILGSSSQPSEEEVAEKQYQGVHYEDHISMHSSVKLSYRNNENDGDEQFPQDRDVQSEPNVGGGLQVYASSPADEHDIEKYEDGVDWDTFQSFPVEDESTSDSVAIENGSMVDSVGEAGSRGTDDHMAVSLEVDDVLNRETCTGLEMGSLDSNVLEERSDIQLCKEDEMLEIKSIEEKGLGNDQQISDSFQPDVGSEKSLGGYTVEEKGQETMGCETDADFILGSSSQPSEEEVAKEQCQGVHDEDDISTHSSFKLSYRNNVNDGGEQFPQDELRTEDNDLSNQNSPAAPKDDKKRGEDYNLKHEGDG